MIRLESFIKYLQQKKKSDVITIIEPESINIKLANIVYGRDLPKFYDNKISVLTQFINKINDIIQKNSQASTIESVKKDKKIRARS